jgi:hypothetical protein
VLIPIIEMLNRGLDSSEIERLIDNIIPGLQGKKAKLDEEKYWILVSNTKSFLKSFYIKINHTSKFASIRASIEKCLDAI